MILSLLLILALTPSANSCDLQTQHEFPLGHATWDGHQFVGIYQDKIETSDDGYYWRSLAATPKSNMSQIFSNGTSYLIPDDSGFYVSEDLLHWRTAPRLGVGAVKGALWAQGKWVIWYSYWAASSSDGLNWESADNMGSFINIVHTGNIFVAAGAPMKYSSDGRTWKQLSRSASQVYVINGRFLALNNNKIFRSNNGRDWSEITLSDSPIGLTSLAYNGTTYLALAEEGLLYSSSDAETWTERPALQGATSLVSFDGHFITQGDINWYSSSGSQWQELGTISNAFFITPKRALYRDGYIENGRNFTTAFVAERVQKVHSLYFTQAYSGLFVSPDGDSWSQLDPGHTSKVYYDQGLWVYFTDGQRHDSSDGINWQTHEKPGLRSSTTYVHGLYFDYGIVSEDGINWESSRISLPLNMIWNGQAFLGTEYDTIYRSTNGRDWEVSSIGYNLTDIYQFDEKVLVGSSEGLFISYDGGERWIRTFAPINTPDMTQWGDRIYALENGTLWSSEDGLFWQQAIVPRFKGESLSNTQTGLIINTAYSWQRITCTPELRNLFLLPTEVIPWVSNNAAWQSRIRLVSHDINSSLTIMQAEDRNGNRQTASQILNPGEVKDLAAKDLFPGFNGYNIQVFTTSSQVSLSLLIYRADDALSEQAGSSAPASSINELSEELLFLFVPGQELPVLAMANLRAEMEETPVVFGLFDEEGTLLGQTEHVLEGSKPFAVTIAALFPDTALPTNGMVRAKADMGAWLAGAGFVFNQAGLPSVARAQSP